jgi:ArsR family transcriptional regulator
MLAEPSRLQILFNLAQGGELHVSALCQMLEESQPAVSHHLKLLRQNKLVQFCRRGKRNFYRLDGVLMGNLITEVFQAFMEGKDALYIGDLCLSPKKK